MRLGDLLNRERFATKLKEVLRYHNFMLSEFYKVDPVDYEQVLSDALAWAEEMRPMVADVVELLHTARRRGDRHSTGNASVLTGRQRRNAHGRGKGDSQ